MEKNLDKKKDGRLGHLFGAENETRTRDPNLGKVVLYQLSYFRLCCVPKVGLEPTRSQ